MEVKFEEVERAGVMMLVLDREKKVEEMERKLEEWKSRLKEREKNWDKVVDHQVKKKTGQLDYMEFPGSPMR